MMRRMTLAAIALTAALAGCSETPIPQEAYKDMQSKPNGSYVMFPEISGMDGNPTGNYTMVVKGHTSRTPTYDKDNKSIVQICSGFELVAAGFDSGKLQLQYSYGFGITRITRHQEPKLEGGIVTFARTIKDEGEGITSHIVSQKITVCNREPAPTN